MLRFADYFIFLLLTFYERLILRYTLTEVRETFILTVIREVSIWVFHGPP